MIHPVAIWAGAPALGELGVRLGLVSGVEVRLLSLDDGDAVEGTRRDLLSAGCRVASGPDGPAALTGCRIVVLGPHEAPGRHSVELHAAERLMEELDRYAPDALVLVASWPQEQLVERMVDRLGREPIRVLAAGRWTEAERIKHEVARRQGLCSDDVDIWVLGPPEGPAVIPQIAARVAGIPMAQLVDASWLKALRVPTANVAPPRLSELAAWTARAVRGLLGPRRTVLNCLTHVRGRFGTEDGLATVPVLLGGEAEPRVWSVELTPEDLGAPGARRRSELQ